MPALSPQAAAELTRYLETFSKPTRIKGLGYYVGNQYEIEDISPSRITGAAFGNDEYYVLLVKTSQGYWSSLCSCPVRERCKHAFAIGLAVTQIKASPPAASAAELSPNRKINEKERRYLNRIESAWKTFQRNGYANHFVFRNLCDEHPGYGEWDRHCLLKNLWVEPPASASELLGYALVYATMNHHSMPPIARELVDFEDYRSRVTKNLRRNEIAEWTRYFGARATPGADTEAALSRFPHDLAFVAGRNRWEIQARPQTPGSAYFPVGSEQVLEWIQQQSGSLSAQAIAFTTVGRDFFERWRGKTTSPKTAIARAFLRQLVLHPELSRAAVDTDYQPLAIAPDPLRWRTLKTESKGEQIARLELVLPDDLPLSDTHSVCLDPEEIDRYGNIVDPNSSATSLYLIDSAVYRGPSPIYGKYHRDIPWESIASPEGVSFLLASGSPLPAEIEGEVKTIEPKLFLRIRETTSPSSWGRARTLCAECVAEGADGRPLKTFTLDGWTESGKSGKPAASGSPIELVNPAGLINLEPLLDAFAFNWTERSDHWEKPLRNDSDLNAFANWLSSVPPAFTIELSPNLAGLDRPSVPIRFEVDIQESDTRDWFDAKLVRRAEDAELTAEEIELLLASPGKLVQLPSGSWRRAEALSSPETEAAIREFSLEKAGESTRLHALQLDNDQAGASLAPAAHEKLVRSVESLRAAPDAHLPKVFDSLLRPYQEEGFRFLSFLTRIGFGGILADDMGLGKTLQALCWLTWLKDGKRPKKGFRAVVICPKSVLHNWTAEAAKFKTGLIATVYSPRPGKAEEAALKKADLVVANYSQLRANPEYFHGQTWDAAILDEGQFIKNPGSQTARAAYQIKSANRLVLTGTPIENRALDLWSLMRFAMPGILGTQARFKRDFNDRKDPEALPRLARRIKPFLLRRAKSQVAKDLPPRIQEELHCELEGPQATLYQAELKKAQQLVIGVKSKTQFDKSRFNILHSLLRLRQICCDPRLLDTQLPKNFVPAKLQALLDLLEPLIAEGHKILVFSQFVTMLELLQRALDEAGIAHLTLTGKTENRAELVERFQKPDTESVFLLSLKAAGTGLNLTAASYVVLFDPWWNPAVEAQAIDRTHRIGQSSQVIAYRLIARNTVEEKIRKLQQEKSALAGAIVDDESLAHTLSLDDIKSLLAE